MPARTYHACAICAHDRKTPSCPHPWKTPFDKWPPHLIEQLKRMVPNGWDVENGGK
jgi:hypothetical protein